MGLLNSLRPSWGDPSIAGLLQVSKKHLNPADPNQFTVKQRQDYFSALGKGPPHTKLELATRGERVFFEPRMNEASMGEYLKTVVPTSIELVGHNLYHTTARIGSQWFDFHWNGPNDSRIVRTVKSLAMDDIKDALVNVKSLTKFYGRRGNKDLALGFCIPATPEQIEKITDAFESRSVPVPFNVNGQDGGESCLSLLTGMIEDSASELGISRTNDSKKLFEGLWGITPEWELSPSIPTTVIFPTSKIWNDWKSSRKVPPAARCCPSSGQRSLI